MQKIIPLPARLSAKRTLKKNHPNFAAFFPMLLIEVQKKSGALNFDFNSILVLMHSVPLLNRGFDLKKDYSIMDLYLQACYFMNSSRILVGIIPDDTHAEADSYLPDSKSLVQQWFSFRGTNNSMNEETLTSFPPSID
jgi:hypothetical protein